MFEGIQIIWISYGSKLCEIVVIINLNPSILLSRAQARLEWNVDSVRVFKKPKINVNISIKLLMISSELCEDWKIDIIKSWLKPPDPKPLVIYVYQVADILVGTLLYLASLSFALFTFLFFALQNTRVLRKTRTNGLGGLCSLLSAQASWALGWKELRTHCGALEPTFAGTVLYYDDSFKLLPSTYGFVLYNILSDFWPLERK